MKQIERKHSYIYTKRPYDWNLHILQSLLDGPLTRLFFSFGPESSESTEGRSSSFLTEKEEAPPRVPLTRRALPPPLPPPANAIGNCCTAMMPRSRYKERFIWKVRILLFSFGFYVVRSSRRSKSEKSGRCSPKRRGLVLQQPATYRRMQPFFVAWHE